jgi:hypothetical protein
MGKSERVEGQESLQTTGGSAGYLRSATTIGSATTRQFLRTLSTTTHLLQPIQHQTQIAHKTAICRNPPNNNFTGERKT